MQRSNQHRGNKASNSSLSNRARSGLKAARREATTPRIAAAAAAIGAAAAAFGLLRDPDRRQRLRQRAHDFRVGMSRERAASGQRQAAVAG